MKADYARADSIALAYKSPKGQSYAQLADALTKSLKTDHDRFRVLFRWVAENIAYSYGNRSGKPDRVLRQRKAVCAGYASLLYSLCASAGIKTEVVTGYSKTRYGDISKKLKKIDHAWNVVWLYGQPYLLDVTWAAGGFDRRKKKWRKDYDNFYFLTPASYFVRDHLPKDKKWQLLAKPIGKRDFTNSHMYHHGFFTNHVVELAPHKGSIKLRLTDSLTIRFTTTDTLYQTVLSTGKDGVALLPQPIGPHLNGTQYQVKQKFERSGTYELTLWLNSQPVSTHRLTVVK